MKLLKKAVGVVLATVMVVTSVASVSAVDNTSTEEKYTAIQTGYVNEKGERFSNIDYSSEFVYPKSRSILPSYYNSADYGYVTSVKNQGETGTCWAYAALSSCESSMIMRNGYDTSLDLSELHLAYAMYHTQRDKLGMFDSYMNFDSENTYLNEGAFAADTLITLANQQGVVLDSAHNGQFSDYKLHVQNPEFFDVYNPEAMYAYNEAYVSNAYKIPIENREQVKQYILNYGSGTLDFCSDFMYYNFETSTYYCYDEERGVDHCVALVGWDDNYPKENCSVNGYTPYEDGAWLIKNSWGETEGNNGYMWISYEDESTKTFPVLFYELTSSEEYINTYQYDDLFSESLLNSTDNYNGAYMANVFTAMNENELLEAVSFYTSNERLDYTVEIYTGIQSDTSPTDGTLTATVSGEDLTMGYHTVRLNNPVVLNKGDKFSVVVCLKDNQDPYRDIYLNIDSEDRGYETKVSALGESFISENGELWEDLHHFTNGNVRVKAFTYSYESPLPLINYYDYYDGKTRDELLSELKVALEESYTYFETEYTYSEESMVELWNCYTYIENVCNNSENFLAIEFAGLANKIKDICDNLTPYTIEDNISFFYKSITSNVMFYDEIPQWNEFISVYDRVVEESKDVTFDYSTVMGFYNTVKEAYVEYMTYAINHGSYASYLQLYGDMDNSGDINIADATAIQMLVADYDSFDFYKYYNYDVDNDWELSIKDATMVQMYVARLVDHFPIYDMKFGVLGGENDDMFDTYVEFDTAVASLQQAVNDVENVEFFDYFNLYFTDLDYLSLWCQYEDAKKVLEHPEKYNKHVINFKAGLLNAHLEFVLMLYS